MKSKTNWNDLELYAIGDSNWDIYIVRGTDYLRAIPKKGTGCKESTFGDIRYLERFAARWDHPAGYIRVTDGKLL